MQTLPLSRPFQEFLLQSRASQSHQVPDFVRLAFATLDQKAGNSFVESKKFGQHHPLSQNSLLNTDLHKQFTELPKLPS